MKVHLLPIFSASRVNYKNYLLLNTQFLSFLVQEVQEEGKHAIDSPGIAANPDMPPEDYELEENEERSMIEPRSMEDPKLQELMYVLIEWINDELADQRIIVKDIAEDLYDGQVLQKLLGNYYFLFEIKK